MTIPNLITVLRLVLVPLVILAIADSRWMAAFLLFVTAGASDAADGFIARRFDMRTEFGAYLDPLADKALLVSIYITMAIGGELPRWLAVLVVSRDLMIVAAIILSRLMDQPMEIRPLFVSKVNTAVQIAFAALVLGMKAFALDIGWLWSAGTGAVAALTVVSAAAYLARWLRHMAGV
ncbi:MAG: CDP-alcohol phosphatidyltransferase family protein [Methylobacteriaceae bacterium]|nr:CDP-alcohol phosphatidyltransferase family protein [Methylobacteriaceae bacterium]